MKIVYTEMTITDNKVNKQTENRVSFYRFLICPITDPKIFGSPIGHIKNL
jgi:hypothetical protein